MSCSCSFDTLCVIIRIILVGQVRYFGDVVLGNDSSKRLLPNTTSTKHQTCPQEEKTLLMVQKVPKLVRNNYIENLCSYIDFND